MKLILIAALAASLAAPGNDHSHHARSAQSATHSQSKPQENQPPSIPVAVQNDIQRIARALEARNDKSAAADENRRAEQDLRDQDQMARWAKAMFWIGLAEILLTALGVWLIFVTWRDARRSSERQLQPYVGVIRAWFQWVGGPGGARIIVRVQNSGQTPATFFEISSAAIAAKPGEKVVSPTYSSSAIWPALGGNDSVTVGIAPERFTDEARKVLDSRGALNFFVLGKVRYGDVWGNEYETEFAYLTSDATPTNGEFSNPSRKMSRNTGKLRTYQQIKT